MSGPDAWEAHAQWWQDGFTDGADPEYEEQILPMVAEHLGDAVDVLDIGTGEGQIARMAAGHRPGRSVIGVDPTWAQLETAQRRAGGPSYARAVAAALPFASGSFDLALACLVFEHIDDTDAALAEVGRVLRPGGTFIFILNHPLLQVPNSGWIDDRILDEQYWRVGPYLIEDSTMEEVEKGILLPFVHRPLSRYVNAMAAAGLFIRRMDEPAPPAGFLARAEEYHDAVSIPRVLFLVARREE